MNSINLDLINRILLAVLIIVSLAFVIVVTVTPLGSILSYRILPSYPENNNETIGLAGLEQKVTVHYDEFGIPHIEAQSAVDLALAVGYVQGKYRFFQLDVLRRFGRGRISELVGRQPLFGSDTVAFDLAMRGWGFDEKADVDLSVLPSFDREVVEAYTKGVNQALAQFPPIEYEILSVTPDLWTPNDSLLVALVQSWSITHNWEQEAVRLALALQLGLSMAEKIYPNEPLPGSSTLQSDADRNFLPPAVAPELISLFPTEPDIEQASKLRAGENPENQVASLAALAELRPSASNAWVVSGKNSENGMPIISGDMHLTHSLPSLLFLQHIKTPELDAIGVTMPGLPFLVGGHNGQVAWSVTSAVADAVDLVIEKKDPRKPGFVLNDGKPCPLVTDKVVVKIRDGESLDEEVFQLRKTCHGPLMNDMYPDYLPEGAPLVAIQWQLPNVEASIGHLYRANAAANVDELRERLMEIPAPIQNITAADTSGDIAFFATGSVPLRDHHRGTFPFPGWHDRYDWSGWTPKEQMPYAKNPASENFVNTNNKVIDPYHHQPIFHVDSAPPYRFDRVVERLDEIETYTAENVADIQNDVQLHRGRELIAYLLSDLQPNQSDAEDSSAAIKQEGESEVVEAEEIEVQWSDLEQKAIDLLKGWDYQATAESPAAAVFFKLYHGAIQTALKEKLDLPAKQLFLKQRYSTNVVDLWFEDAQHPVWDDLTTEAYENRGTVIRTVFREVVQSLAEEIGEDPNQWQWGKFHVHHPKHLFGSQAVLDFFNLEKTPLGGALDSVWKAHFNLGNDSSRFKVVAGPAYRQIVDLAKLDEARFSIDTGQSGWPLSPHYGDQYELWRDGKLAPMQYDWEELIETADATTILVPQAAQP